jgi:hypothetical protein
MAFSGSPPPGLEGAGERATMSPRRPRGFLNRSDKSGGAARLRLHRRNDDPKALYRCSRRGSNPIARRRTTLGNRPTQWGATSIRNRAHVGSSASAAAGVDFEIKRFIHRVRETKNSSSRATPAPRTVMGRCREHHHRKRSIPRQLHCGKGANRRG